MGRPDLTAAGQQDSSPVVCCRGLAKRFGETPVLGSIDLEVGRGEHVCVLGPSGAGKSTLLHCLGTIVRPSEGRVQLLGRDVTDLDDERLAAVRRRHIGFVFQAGLLLGDLNGIENVALPLLLDGVASRPAFDRAAVLLEGLGVSRVTNRRPGAMSGGEAQRVAIARALVNDPAIVFADEPTGSLDSRNAERVIDLLLDATSGRTLIVVTHERALADRFDLVVELVDGRVRSTLRPTAPGA